MSVFMVKFIRKPAHGEPVEPLDELLEVPLTIKEIYENRRTYKGKCC